MDNYQIESSQGLSSFVTNNGGNLTYTFVTTNLPSTGQSNQNSELTGQAIVQSGHTVIHYPSFPQAHDMTVGLALVDPETQTDVVSPDLGQGIIQMSADDQVLDQTLDTGQSQPQQVFLQLDSIIHGEEETDSKQQVFSSVVATLSQHLLNAIPGMKDVFLQELCKPEKLVLLSDVDNNFFSVSGPLESVVKFGQKLRIFISHPSNDDSDKENTCDGSSDTEEIKCTSNVDVGINCELLKPQVTSRGRFIKKPLKFESSYVSGNFSGEEESEDTEVGKTFSRRKASNKQTGKKLGRPEKLARIKHESSDVDVCKSSVVTDRQSDFIGSQSVGSELGKEIKQEQRYAKESLETSYLSVKDTSQEINDKGYDEQNIDDLKGDEITETQKKSRLYELKMPYKYFCKLCSFKTKRESHFLKHKALHQQKPDLPILQCKSCSFKCIRASVLQIHQMNHGDNRQLFRCAHCKFVTNKAKQLQVHSNIKHAADSKKPVRPILHCYMSGCKFQTKFHLKMRKHLKLHGIHVSQDNCKTTTFQCGMCPYKTSRKGHLARHMNNVHTDRRPYLCDLCGMTFKRQDTLSAHKTTHLEKSERSLPVKCIHCNKGFKSQAHMKEHLSVHSSARTYLCHICGAAFKTKAVQKKHTESIHVHPRAYSCEVCHKAFNTKHALQRHCRTHVSLMTDTQPQEVEQVPQVNIEDIQTISIPAEQLSQLALQAVSGSQEGFAQDVISVPSIEEALEQGEDIHQYNIQTNEATTALLYLPNIQQSVDVDNI